MVLRLLKSRILRGIYKDRLPGERDLAEELGVSAPTVKVAVIQLEAIGLVERRQRQGTFVVPADVRVKTFEPMSVFLSQALTTLGQPEPDAAGAFSQAAQARGLDVTLRLHPRADVDKAVDEVLSHLRNLTCVGACMLTHPIDTARALRLAEAQGPVVVADWEAGDLILPTVVHDNREAGRLAAAHLLKLGHRRIAFVDPIPPSPARNLRAEAAGEMVRLFGGVFRHAHYPEHNWGLSCNVALLSGPDRPTAAIGVAHKTCFELAAAAGSLRMSVPRDLSLVCMGSIPLDRQEEPFTNIAFDLSALGTMALEMLLATEPGKELQKKLVPVRLEDRGTTAPPPAE